MGDELDWPFAEEKNEGEGESKGKIDKVQEEMEIEDGSSWLYWLAKVALLRGADAEEDPEAEGTDWCSIYFRKKGAKKCYRLGCDWSHLSDDEIDFHVKVMATLGLTIYVNTDHTRASINKPVVK